MNLHVSQNVTYLSISFNYVQDEEDEEIPGHPDNGEKKPEHNGDGEGGEEDVSLYFFRP